MERAAGSERRVYESTGGIEIVRREETHPGTETGRAGIEALIDALDARRGGVFASACEVPGRYALWDRGFVDPPLAIESRDRLVHLRALNARGVVLLPALCRAVEATPGARLLAREPESLRVEIVAPAGCFAEEDRSRQPSVFGLLRSIVALFGHPDEPDLGLYGAFGYDLAFQFDPLRLRHERAADQRDLVLYLPDEVVVVDHRRQQTHRVRYDFAVDGVSTAGLARGGENVPYRAGRLSRGCDHEPGEYAQVVRRARAAFARGDLFEVVPSQVFSEGCSAPPSRGLPPPARPQPRALRVPAEPGPARDPGRRLPRDVRARRRRRGTAPRSCAPEAGRDLPHRRHDRARPRRARGRGPRPRAARFGRRTSASSPCARTSTATTRVACASPGACASWGADRSSCTRA